MMIRLNQELIDLTNGQLFIDFANTDNLTFERLASMLTAVHSLKQKYQLSRIITNDKVERLNLEFKVEIMQMYYDTVKHFINCL